MAKRNSPLMKSVHKQEAIDRLRSVLSNNMTVYSACVGVAGSGMSANYRFFIPVNRAEYDNNVIVKSTLEIRDLTFDISIATGEKIKDDGSIRISGCGLNRPLHLLDYLSSVLTIEGEGRLRLNQRDL